jgi:hypothetical protein
MNFCPECGKKVHGTGLEKDIATEHYTWQCTNNHTWEETVMTNGDTLSISPIDKGEESEKD